jgi:predicted DNA-binding ribbon-helix-helix protein
MWRGREAAMKSTIVKRSIKIGGHPTSIGLEAAFWNGLREIAHQRNETVTQLITRIDEERKSANLSSNLRLFVLGFYQDEYNSSKLVDLASEDADPSPDHFDTIRTP